jgi:hypothetical protein
MQPILLICGSRVVSLAATIGYTSGRHRPPSPATSVAGPVSPIATRRSLGGPSHQLARKAVVRKHFYAGSALAGQLSAALIAELDQALRIHLSL